MKPFLNENFLLTTATAERLYHDYAAQMPVIDYHCHLDPALIASDHRFNNLTEAWLRGDHYKWRAMRTNGIPEQFITGDATDEEKFEKWAETVPCTVRNPLYHWTHLELQRYFGITDPLSPVTGHEIYHKASALLQTPDFSVRRLLEKMNVEVVCTTDDPLDTLDAHRQIAESDWSIKVLPTWRSDKAMSIENPKSWNLYLDKLSSVAEIEIEGFRYLLEALGNRHDFFHSMGCRLSDHGLNTFYSEKYTDQEISRIFDQARSGRPISEEAIRKFKSAMLYELAVMDAEKGWVQQFHIGAMRNTNTRMIGLLGPDTGFDSIGDEPVALPMARFFDRLGQEGKLAKTILYNLNPRDNEVFATMTGNFQDGSVPGKMQWGSGWWFLDQKDGMEKQLNTLSNMGLLSRFVGMLTDSRSFLSYPRHEYFRRILCNLIGRDVENGELPDDMTFFGRVVLDVCYYNAFNYFDFK
ncbi:MAG: glucuronate isomerase [Bacteroidetes bacterium GWF2_49_14]|nr:MAG: glucuronate isomerase [Bacteroidetes bacterium GWF2_49_14]